MSKLNQLITTLVLIVLLILTFPYLVYIGKVIFISKSGMFLKQLTMYQWAGVGMLSYAILERKVKHNITWFETLTHEMIHGFFALILQGRVHSLHADEGKGVISHSGVKKWGRVSVSLAPYCFPLYTYMLLSIRHLLDFHGKWVFDIIIGVSLAFHIICFRKQIGNHQTDINQYPLAFSYFYIVVSWIINLCIILVSFWPNMYTKGPSSPFYYGYGMWSSLLRWPNEMWNTLTSFF